MALSKPVIMKVLSINAIPPPIHGSNVVNLRLNQVLTNSDEFEFEHLDYSFVTRIDQIGKFSLEKIFKFVLLIMSIVRILIRNKYDIIYFPIVIGRSVVVRDLIVLYLIQNLRRKARVVTHFHSKGVNRHNCLIKKTLFYGLRNATLIHLSESLIEVPSKFKKNCVVIPNSVAEPKVDMNVGQAPVISFFSNLIKDKGIDVFLDVCSILKTEGHLFKAQIAGKEGDLYTTDYLEKRILNLGLQDLVVYKGLVQNESKELFLNESDIIILPTRYKNECMPLSLLEGMTYGNYIISSNEGAIPDIVKPEFGSIVAANSSEIATELGRIFSSTLLSKENKLIRSAKGIELFSNGVMEDKFINLLKTLCAE